MPSTDIECHSLHLRWNQKCIQKTGKIGIHGNLNTQSTWFAKHIPCHNYFGIIHTSKNISSCHLCSLFSVFLTICFAAFDA